MSESPLFEREHLEANVSSELTAAEQPSESEVESHPVRSQAQSTSEVQTEHEVDTPAGSFDLVEHEQHAAPSVAPEGRTLEHEVLEDEEAEFQAVPDDLNAMREVAGDEELVLEEETLDANGFSDRWVPKIEDVDEDEIVAAEERGEKIYTAEEEEDEEAEGEEEEVADRAEIRAATPTAGYQQRTAQRPGYERRGGRFDRDRGRRGGSRRNNVRTPRQS